MPQRTVGVHPLVVVTACDHHTRVSVGNSLLPPDAPAVGLLFGTKTADSDDENSSLLHIVDATDGVYSYDSGSGTVSLNLAQVTNKRDLWQQVYPTQPLLGWYALGSKATPEHINIHRDICSLMEEPSSALFLLIDPLVNSDMKHLPIVLFEMSEVDGAQVFVEVPFKLESSPIESIVMDKVVSSNPPEGISSVEVQNQSLVSSFNTLVAKVDIIIDELSKMQSGVIPINYEILRKASQICKLLPSQQNETAGDRLDVCLEQDLSDTLALSVMGTISSNLKQLHVLQSTYQQTYGESGRGASVRRY